MEILSTTISLELNGYWLHDTAEFLHKLIHKI